VSDISDPWLRLEIHPEPTFDEREALIAALTTYFAAASRTAASEREFERVSRWALRGRREAVNALSTGSRMGWGRDRSGWS
jgi:hypothetical protein